MKTLGLALLLSMIFSHVRAVDWPKGFVIEKESVSPDGRYGIVVPSIDSHDLEKANFGETNYLGDIKEHRLLGKVQDARYWERGGHVSLEASWSADSRLCLLRYQGRYDTHSVVVVEIEADGSGFRQASIAEPARKMIEAAVDSQMKGSEDARCAWFYSRLGQGREVLVRGVASNNVKEYPDSPTYCAYFSGVCDIAAGKWTESEAVPVTDEQKAALSDLLDVPAPGSGFTESDREYAEVLPEELDGLYRSLRILLPTDQRLRLESEQAAWLELKAAESAPKVRNAMTAKRILELRDMAWNLRGTGFLRG